MEPVTAALIGAGMRGRESYSSYALENPMELKITAVAEPVTQRREAFAKEHNLSGEACFATWQELLNQPKLADAVFICTQDNNHHEVTLKALEKGYHILLEKPMSNNAAECTGIVRAAAKTDRILSVCHVLRYTPFFGTMKQIIDSGELGEIVTMEHSENVGYWHQAHSYVRGNWRNSKESSPMILAKSCHDFDILLWLIGKRCHKISSFGALNYFRPENAPDGAPKRCLNGCPARHDCAFYAPHIYNGNTWQAKVIRRVVSPDPSPKGLSKALLEGPYGRCVFYCDNDVVDHQVVNMEFDHGITASFTMTAFTYEETRRTRILGTKGELTGVSMDNHIQTFNFRTGLKKTWTLNQSDEGHGGGDHGIVRDFVQSVIGNTKSRSSAEMSLQSHLMAFAAEQSRLTHMVIDLDEFENGLI